MSASRRKLGGSPDSVAANRVPETSIDESPCDSAEIRARLVDALRLDLIGPRPDDETLQRERLPQAPSRWYLTGFLVPSDAPQGQRAQDVEEEIDEPVEPPQGADDAREPERVSGKRAFLPSSMGFLRSFAWLGSANPRA